jgi:hypothetical protein
VDVAGRWTEPADTTLTRNQNILVIAGLGALGAVALANANPAAAVRVLDALLGSSSTRSTPATPDSRLSEAEASAVTSSSPIGLGIPFDWLPGVSVWG